MPPCRRHRRAAAVAAGRSARTSSHPAHEQPSWVHCAISGIPETTKTTAAAATTRTKATATETAKMTMTDNYNSDNNNNSNNNNTAAATTKTRAAATTQKEQQQQATAIETTNMIMTATTTVTTTTTTNNNNDNAAAATTKFHQLNPKLGRPRATLPPPDLEHPSTARHATRQRLVLGNQKSTEGRFCRILMQ